MKSQIDDKIITQEEQKNYNYMLKGWKQDQRNSLSLRQSYRQQNNNKNVSNSEYLKPPKKASLDKMSVFQQYSTEIINYLKAKYIIEQIVQQFQQSKFIDLTEQQAVQFMHLLCFRAWCDIKSAINTFLDFNFSGNNQKKNQLTKNINQNETLKTIVTSMFKLNEKIQNMFNLYHKILSFRQKSFAYRLKSFIDFIFHNAAKAKRDNILFGVQGDNFTRDQQIQYTQINLIPIIRKKLLDVPGKNSLKMRNQLLAYKKIMNIQFQKLQSLNDFQILKKTIVKQAQTNLKIKPILH